MEIAWLKKHEGNNSRDKTNENSFMILKRVFIVTAFAVRVFKEETDYTSLLLAFSKSF